MTSRGWGRLAAVVGVALACATLTSWFELRDSVAADAATGPPLARVTSADLVADLKRPPDLDARAPHKPLADRPAYAPHDLLIRFKADVGVERQKEILASIDATEVERLGADRSLVHIRMGNRRELAAAEHALVNVPEVESSERNVIYYASTIPNDPLFREQWALESASSVTGPNDPDIDAPEAWDELTGGSGVVIGLIDTGVDYNHADLTDNMWRNPREIPSNGIDDDHNGWVDDIYGIDAQNEDGDPKDDNGHGTHVAGTMAARGDNGIGTTGVLWHAQIATCRFLDSDGAGYLSDALQCFDYFARLKTAGVNIVVTNNSWGSGLFSQALLDALNAQRSRGILAVAAAGNDGLDIDSSKTYPAAYNVDTIIAVAATERDGSLAWFSNKGVATVDIAAPGVDIISTLPGDGYGFASGTSMAAPHVAAAIALYAMSDVSANAARLTQYVVDSATIDPALQAYVRGGKRLHLNLPFVDTDGDGMSDRFESANNLNPNSAADAHLDADSDGLDNLAEYKAHTNPRDADTDDDGLKDGEEVQQYRTNPRATDTDGDGLSDAAEVKTHHTNPTVADTDGDGLSDFDEIDHTLTDPTRADSDGDGMSDGYETKYFLNPRSAGDAAQDPDGDGLTNLQEFQFGTSPRNKDSDGDGLSDREEAVQRGTDPAKKDTDGDGMDDGWEVRFGFDPRNGADGVLDADGDGYSNGDEFRGASDPTNPSALPLRRPWTTMQGDASHSGYVPIDTTVGDFALKWFVSANVGSGFVIGAREVVSARSDYLGSAWVESRDVATGELKWSTQLIDAESFGAISLGGGRAYIMVDRRGVTSQIIGIDIDSGAIVMRADFDSVDLASRLVYFDGHLYASDRDTLISVDANTGVIAWRTPINDTYPVATATVTVDATHVVAAIVDHFWILDRATGTVRSTTAGTCNGASALQAAVMLNAAGTAFAHYGNCIARFDLVDGVLDWQVTNADNYGEPALDEQFVYYRTTDGAIRAIRQSNGGEAWRWSGTNTWPQVVNTRNHVFVVADREVVAIDKATHQKTWSLPYSGLLAATDDGALVVNGEGMLASINVERDHDGDGLPDWWERYYTLNAFSAADVTQDPDADGLDNRAEFASKTNPRNGDTDDDLLSDADELQRGTSARDADWDDDGVTDGEEVYARGSDPSIVDTDGDTVSDGDEVGIYHTDPANRLNRPNLLTDYAQSFESGLPGDWLNAPGSAAGWAVTRSDSTDGNFALVAPTIAPGAVAATEWTARFDAGELAFDARSLNFGCCHVLMNVLVDGVVVKTDLAMTWERVTLSLPQGAHTIRFEWHGPINPGTDETARIDNVTFRRRDAFAGDVRDILISTYGTLGQFRTTGETALVPLVLPRPEFPLPTDVAVTANHEIVVAAAPLLLRVDAVTGHVRRTEVPGWNIYSSQNNRQSLAVVGPYVLAPSQTGIHGVIRFDADGRYVDTKLTGKSYDTLVLGRDGYLYGRSPVPSAPIIDRIDTNTWSVVASFDPGCFSCGAFAVDARGHLFIINFEGDSLIELDASGRHIDQDPFPFAWGWIDIEQPADATWLFGGSSRVLATNDTLKPIYDFAIPHQFLSSSVWLSLIRRDGPDRDGDGMPDWWEAWGGLDPRSAADRTSDADGDGLANIDEYQHATDPRKADTDGDGVNDRAEAITYASDPTRVDTDGDGLSDGDEVNRYRTNPIAKDSDGDALSDADELQIHHTDPLRADTDGDGANDGSEIANGLDPLTRDDLTADLDGDGLTNGQELANHTQMRVKDTDNDGLFDGEEVLTRHSNPLLGDTDGDHLDDAWEARYGFDLLADREGALDPDADGYSTLAEYFAQTDPRLASSKPVAAPWVTYRGDAGHTGFVPVHIEVGSLRAAWSHEVIAGDMRPLSEVAAVDDAAFLVNSLSGYCCDEILMRLKASTGELQWRFDLHDIHHLTPPAYARGRVLFSATPSQYAGYLGVLSADSGAVVAQPQVTVVGDGYQAPTPFLADAFGVDAGRGAISSVRLPAGTLRWARDTQLESQLTPTVTRNFAFAFPVEGNSLVGYDRESGRANLIIPDPNTRGSTWDPGAPVATRTGDVFARWGERLLAFDLAGERIRWGVERNYVGQPAAAMGRVYVTTAGGDVAVIDDRNGAELWTWAAPHAINHALLLTYDHLIASTDTDTYVVDLKTHATAWTYAKGGEVSLGNSGELYIASNDGVLTAVSIFRDDDRDRMADAWERSEGLDPTRASDAPADADGDGLTNLDEFHAGTNPHSVDTDADGLSDADEIRIAFTDARDADSDDDGLADGNEVHTRTTNPNAIDTDGDGLSDSVEVQHGTNPKLTDTDGDSYNDDWETRRGSDPADPSSVPPQLENFTASFEDGAPPAGWHSVGTLGWKPSLGDATDGGWVLTARPTPLSPVALFEWTDRFAATVLSFDVKVTGECCSNFGMSVDSTSGPSASEGPWRRVQVLIPEGVHTLRFGSGGNGSYDNTALAEIDNVTLVLADADDDGMLDDWERQNGLDPADASDATADPDGDGLTSHREFELGTLPRSFDSDADGMDDGWEVRVGLNPMNDDARFDIDGDGYTDLQEYNAKTDPLNANSKPSSGSGGSGSGGGSGGNPPPAGGGGGGGGGAVDVGTLSLLFAVLWRSRRNVRVRRVSSAA